MNSKYRIETVEALEATVGEPMEFVRAKVASRLDDVMQAFIRRAPLAFVSTIDADGQVDVSPKGDPAGFVHIENDITLLIPERPGNKLTFGFRNILQNGAIGLIFLVPNQRETLRVKGRATLHRDPEVLQELEVNGKPALLYTRVTVTECFIHCGKAMIRSRLWQPEHWDSDKRSLGARQFASLSGGDAAAVEATESRLEASYRDELY